MRRWTGDRFVGDLDENEEPPFMDMVGHEVRALDRHMSEATLAALKSVDKAPYDPTTGFFGEKSLDKTPNSATVTVTNLAPSEVPK